MVIYKHIIDDWPTTAATTHRHPQASSYSNGMNKKQNMNNFLHQATNQWSWWYGDHLAGDWLACTASKYLIEATLIELISQAKLWQYPRVEWWWWWWLATDSIKTLLGPAHRAWIIECERVYHHDHDHCRAAWMMLQLFIIAIINRAPTRLASLGPRVARAKLANQPDLIVVCVCESACSPSALFLHPAIRPFIPGAWVHSR